MLAVAPRGEGEPPWAAVADCAQLLAGERVMGEAYCPCHGQVRSSHRSHPSCLKAYRPFRKQYDEVRAAVSWRDRVW
jgi:hypothetical protein